MSWKTARRREIEREAQREFDHYNSGKGSWVKEELEREEQGKTPANSGERTESPLTALEHILFTKETCRCNKWSDYPCDVCDGGLAICSLCGKAEAELDAPCNPAQSVKEHHG